MMDCVVVWVGHPVSELCFTRRPNVSGVFKGTAVSRGLNMLFSGGLESFWGRKCDPKSRGGSSAGVQMTNAESVQLEPFNKVATSYFWFLGFVFNQNWFIFQDNVLTAVTMSLGQTVDEQFHKTCITTVFFFLLVSSFISDIRFLRSLPPSSKCHMMLVCDSSHQMMLLVFSSPRKLKTPRI